MIARRYLTALLAISALYGSYARASTTLIPPMLPDAQYSANLNSNTLMFGSVPYNISTATWSVSEIINPNPTISAVGNSVPNNLPVETTMDYYFEVVDTSGVTATPLPILIDVSGDIILTSAERTSFGNFDVVGVTTGLINTTHLTCGFVGATGCGTFDVDYHDAVMTDTLYYISLQVLGSNFHSSSSATIDPLVEIDPSNPNAADFAVLTSPGVGNTASGVPEVKTGSCCWLDSLVSAVSPAVKRHAKSWSLKPADWRRIERLPPRRRDMNAT
jgi:hypothetical protein